MTLPDVPAAKIALVRDGLASAGGRGMEADKLGGGGRGASDGRAGDGQADLS